MQGNEEMQYSGIPAQIRNNLQYSAGSLNCICLNSRDTADIVLEAEVIGMIYSLYEDLEKYHGKMLVSRVLGLLTAATDGMNSDDVLNILSCDEELLKDVLVWHEPPKRRLPPLLLARLKHDLGPFLVERGAFGVSLLALFHRYCRVLCTRTTETNNAPLRPTF